MAAALAQHPSLGLSVPARCAPRGRPASRGPLRCRADYTVTLVMPGGKEAILKTKGGQFCFNGNLYDAREEGGCHQGWMGVSAP